MTLLRAAIQDLTYVSQIKNIDGQPKKGFKVFERWWYFYHPKGLAKPLYEFLPEEDYLRLAQPIWTVFNNAESLRKNRMMARLKVLIDRIGLDEFRGLVEAELSQIGPIDPSPYMDITDLQRETPPVSHGNGSDGVSSDEQSEFGKWKESNVFKQKQEGYYLVYVKPVRGVLKPPNNLRVWQLYFEVSPVGEPVLLKNRIWHCDGFPRISWVNYGLLSGTLAWLIPEL
ncbi:MAG: hypothetical protein CM1200mP35_10140 [Chloroflexota bacterium]|nr:MAG: hypothetical protein CM1200mP35_10140 [Chloroflexota bacterium]